MNSNQIEQQLRAAQASQQSTAAAVHRQIVMLNRMSRLAPVPLEATVSIASSASGTLTVDRPKTRLHHFTVEIEESEFGIRATLASGDRVQPIDAFGRNETHKLWARTARAGRRILDDLLGGSS